MKHLFWVCQYILPFQGTVSFSPLYPNLLLTYLRASLHIAQVSCNRYATKMDGRNTTIGPNVNIVIWVCLVIPGFAVLSKILTTLVRNKDRIKLRSLHADDGFLALALVSLLPYYVRILLIIPRVSQLSKPLRFHNKYREV